jgi:hypothetical protein
MKGKITLFFEGGYYTVIEQWEGSAANTLYHGTDGGEAKRIFDQAVTGR